jgi:hypothetical protein
MVKSSGKDAKESCMMRILERDRPSTPSWIKEQASIQLKHPWHFFTSTRRYPSAGGIASAGMRICPVPGVAVAVGSGALVGASVPVGAGALVGVGVSSALKRLHPPVPATKMMAPVTFMKSRREIAPTGLVLFFF